MNDRIKISEVRKKIKEMEDGKFNGEIFKVESAKGRTPAVIINFEAFRALNLVLESIVLWKICPEKIVAKRLPHIFLREDHGKILNDVRRLMEFCGIPGYSPFGNILPSGESFDEDFDIEDELEAELRELGGLE
jgi:hypothetical protein